MAQAWTSVWGSFTAQHADRFNMTDVHQHTWNVEAFWPSEHVHDMRSYAYKLEEELKPLNGGRLPDQLAWAESLARHFAIELVAISVRVWREGEKHAATYTLTDREYCRARRRNQGRY